MTQIVPVFNPVSGVLEGFEARQVVHQSKCWHRGVQAHVVRPNNRGSFEVLLQVRSDKVDIGGHKFDQSLATQMTDDDKDEIDVLRRGLRDELGIKHFRLKKINTRIWIDKTYADQPGIRNCELIALYVVNTLDVIAARSPKVDRLFWLEWTEALAFFAANREKFTRTGRLYFEDPQFVTASESQAADLLGLPKRSADNGELPSCLFCLDHAGHPIVTIRADSAEQLFAQVSESADLSREADPQ